MELMVHLCPVERQLIAIYDPDNVEFVIFCWLAPLIQIALAFPELHLVDVRLLQGLEVWRFDTTRQAHHIPATVASSAPHQS